MSESDLRRIVAHLDRALGLFQAHEGHMTATDIRERSLLAVIRSELIERAEEGALAQGLSAQDAVAHAR
ncbi:MAG: hypothetical protein ACREFX_14170 [Opitutaceae bacterium]